MNQMIARVFTATAVWLLLLSPACADDIGDYLPEHVDFIITVNFAKLVESPLAKQYLPELIRKYGFEIFREMAAETGIKKRAFDNNEDNIRRVLSDAVENRRWLEAYGKAVQRITFGGRLDSSEEPEIVIFEGNWDARLLDGLCTFSALAAPENLKVIKEGKRKYFQFLPQEGATPFGAILSDEMAVMAPTKEALFRAMDLHEGKRVQSKARKELRDMIRKLDPDTVIGLCLYDANNKFSIMASLYVDKEIRIIARAVALNEIGAVLLANGIRGFIRELKEQTAQIARINPTFRGVVDAFDKVEVEQIENEVHVRGRLPAEAIHKVMKELLSNKE
ncbi:hypothetical protein [Thermogemmata fonticola]|uniref:DUF3352 domain-containing protein n=1 Tax=Thermogemmata fonticola TaxID=2755323 RepID=A0A7V9ACY9_9BACT|nr:hypothetical protein [Thermogemmata fonticola]MBA2227544.1 hypothetical protein [Thermogemmata fonticola]